MNLPTDPPDELELRVLDGPQAGARATLARGTRCVLAAEPDGQGHGADIVLREEQLAPARVRITVNLPNALLEVLHGEVRLGEQLLSSGAQVPWAVQVPLGIGGSTIAFGRAGLDDWTRGAAPVEPPAGPTSGPHPPAVAARPPLRRRAEVWLATLGGGVVLTCAGALWLARGVGAAPPAAPSAMPLGSALRDSEFAALSARTRADGRIELRGRLATRAERARLDAWLEAQRAAPLLDVQVDEVLATAVTEVFRVNGIAAQARVGGPGSVSADVAERNHERLARAEEAVRRDVRGLATLTVRNSAAPLLPPPVALVDDPGKRIASVVPGTPAYVVTADGAHYFVGALLPSGHRITQVARQQVTLERDGRQSTLNF